MGTEAAAARSSLADVLLSPDPVVHRALAALSAQNQPQRLGAVPAPRRPHRGHQLVHADLHPAARVLRAPSCSCPASPGQQQQQQQEHGLCSPASGPGSSAAPIVQRSCSGPVQRQPAGTQLLIAFATISCSGRGNRLQIKRSITIFLIDALEPYFPLPRSDGRWFGSGSGWVCSVLVGTVTFWCSECPCRVPPPPGELGLE